MLCSNLVSMVQPLEEPLSAKVAKKSLEVIINEKLAENAFELGNYLEKFK